MFEAVWKAIVGRVAGTDNSAVERSLHELCCKNKKILFCFVFVLFLKIIQPVAQPKSTPAMSKKGVKDELELEIDFGDAGRKTNPKGILKE